MIAHAGVGEWGVCPPQQLERHHVGLHGELADEERAERLGLRGPVGTEGLDRCWSPVPGEPGGSGPLRGRW